MPGFLGYIGNNSSFTFCSEERKQLVQSSIQGKDYRIERRTINKFLQDKIFVDAQDFIVITEGVILNKLELMKEYGEISFFDCVVNLYKKLGDTFFNRFRGSFSGLLYDKQLDKWLIYTDHTGDKQVFYSPLEDGLLFGTEMRFMVETLKANHLPITLNKTGAYLVLTHGFTMEDHTLVTEVKRLAPGHYLRYDISGLQEIQYHRFSNRPKQMTVEEAVEGIDCLFRQAVKRQFEKDREYGYKHITTLSGGLDSRMTVWVAHQLGYTEQLNTTFSQSNYLDFTIAQQIATDLKHEFLFKALDHGNFIKNLDDITPLTYGNANFFGLAHGKSLYDLINFEPFGIMHTGMIGDAIVGTFFRTPEYKTEVKIGQGAYSLQLIERLNDYRFKYAYENEEIFCLYTRAFTGANEGMVGYQERTEAISPFCDVDFLEFCYSIPLLLRYNHKVYFDWIFRKYPGAAEYVWEKIKAKIQQVQNKEFKYMLLLGRRVPAITDKRFPTWLKGSILRRLGLRKKGEKPKTLTIPGKDNMNPVDYWYNENVELREFMNIYWEENKHYIPDNLLLKDMENLFNNGVVYDKLQILSTLSAIKLIYQ